MKHLQDNFRKRGFDYELIYRSDVASMYKQSVNGVFVAYEVFLKKISKESVAFGRVFEESESFPTDEAFGKWVWSISDFEKAKNMFNELTLKGVNK